MHPNKNIKTLPLLILIIYFLIPAPAWSVDISTSNAEHARGIQLFRNGEHAEAVLSWKNALRQYSQEGDLYQASKVLVNISDAYLALGQVQAAIDSLNDALQLAREHNDNAWLATVHSQLGATYVNTKNWEQAEKHLQQALLLIKTQKSPAVEANTHLSLGNLNLAQGNYQEAINAYRSSLEISRGNNLSNITTKALVNIATALESTGKTNEVKSILEEALTEAGKLPSHHEKSFLLLKTGRMLHHLISKLPDARTSLTQSAYSAFTQSLETAESTKDWRSASYALGYLGTLYEDNKRFDEALQFTRRALFYIQQGYAPEVQYRWEWQAARLYTQLGDFDNALAAYARATSNLQAIRIELSSGYENGEPSFDDAVKPVFLQYTDLLLQQGEQTPDNSKRQEYYKQARQTVELLKAAELEDYFKDDCVAAAKAKIKDLEEALSDTTAIIYPILFLDRLELLVSYQKGLVKYTVNVTADELRNTVTDFRAKLEKRTTRQYLRPSRKLYNWLIRPLKQDFDSRGIKTLVYVPDAVFRNIPFSALNDGKDYLIEHYALATTPGLDLTDPRPLKRDNINLLLNGLTDAVQGFPALVHVPHEIESIRNLYGGTTLFNKDFSLSSLEQQLKDNEYSVIHIASHGKFAGKVKDSFLLTHDEKLTMDDLEQYIGQSKLRLDKPIELLTLSACETAAGDDQSGLGLASVAIKAGARSALATLWSIDDKSTSMLVIEFYRQLKNPDNTKAQALQQAQLKTLADLRYRHPGYWAPFLLIGNWL